MIEARITYDMFNPDLGLMTVKYKIFNGVTETGTIKLEMARAQIEARVRNLICDGIEKLRNQRNENYRYGDGWNIKASKVLDALPMKIITACRLTDLQKFADYVKNDIRPLMDDIRPGITSRFREGYDRKIDLLDSYIHFIHKNPGFSEVLNTPLRMRKAV